MSLVQLLHLRNSLPTTGCPKILYLILRLKLEAVLFAMTKMVVLADSGATYKLLGT